MASQIKSAGKVGVEAVPLTGGFAGELRRKLKVIEETLKVKVNVEIDTDRLQKTLNTFQDKYKVKVEAVLDASSIGKGMAREVGKSQQHMPINEVVYSPEFDMRPFERSWAKFKKITDEIEKSLGNSESDQKKRQEISLKRQEMEQKIFFSPAITPESQSKLLKDVNKEIREYEKDVMPMAMRVEYNKKSGQEAIAAVEKEFQNAMKRMGKDPANNPLRSEIMKEMEQFWKSHKANLELGELSGNWAKSAPAMYDMLDKLKSAGVEIPVELEPIDKVTISRMRKELEDRFNNLSANIDPKLNNVDKVRDELNKAYKSATNSIDDLEVNMKLGLVDDQARVDTERLIHDVNGRQVGLQVDANVMLANARLREFMQRPRTATIHVDANTKKAAAEMKALLASMSGADAANAPFKMLNGFLTNAATLLPKIAIGSSVIGGIGAAAVSSIGGIASLVKDMEKLLGVVGMLPAAIGGLAVMGGTLLTAFNGVGAATARLAEDRSGGGGVVRNSKVQAIQVAQAQRRISTAHENAADATVRADERIIETQTAVKDAVMEQGQDRIRSMKAIRDAQWDLDEANADAMGLEEKMIKARKKAAKSIIDLQRTLENAVLSRREAEIDYAKALQAYESASSDTSRSQNEMTELELALDKASQKVKDTKGEESDLREERDAAAKAGIEGAEDYVSALRDVEDSQKRITRAEERMAYARAENATNEVKYAGRVRNAILDEERARKSAADTARTSARSIIEAEEAMYMLMAQRTDTASRAEDAMKALTPEGRRAAEAFLHVREMLSSVRAIVQENFFKGFTTPMVSMVQTLLPQLERGMGNVSTVMGQGWGMFFSALQQSLSGGVLERILNNMAKAIENGNEAIGPLVRAFVDITDVGAQLLPGIMQTFAQWADRFSQFIAEAKADGSLKQWMEDGITGVKELARILEGAYGIFKAIATAATSADGMTMSSLGDSLNKTADIMAGEKFQNALKHVFKGADAAMKGIEGGMVAIGNVFAENGPAIEKIIGSLGQNLGKIITLFAKVLGDPKVMSGLQSFLDGVGRGVDKLIEASPEISAFIGSIMEIGGELFELFAVAFAEVAKFVGPILSLVTPLIKFLIDVVTFFAPFIAFFIPIGKIFFGITTAAKLFGGAAAKLTDKLNLLNASGKGLSAFFEGFGAALGKIMPGAGKWIAEIGPKLAKGFEDIVAKAGTWFNGLGPAIFAGFVAGLTGVVAGVQRAVGWFMEQINRFFPHSPALEGPFSGKGWTLYSGAALGNGFADGITSSVDGAKNAARGFVDGVRGGFNNAMQGLESVSVRLLDALGFNGTELVNSGKSLLRGLGEGIKSVSPQLYSTIQGVMANVRKYFPFSPAKLGPFSGRGYTTYSGRALGYDFAAGIMDSTGAVSKASLGIVKAVEFPNSIKSTVATMDAIGGPGASAGYVTHIENHINEAVSAKATAMELNRLQKAKRP